MAFSVDHLRCHVFNRATKGKRLLLVHRFLTETKVYKKKQERERKRVSERKRGREGVKVRRGRGRWYEVHHSSSSRVVRTAAKTGKKGGVKTSTMWA